MVKRKLQKGAGSWWFVSKTLNLGFKYIFIEYLFRYGLASFINYTVILALR